jgi:hypothetical protein
MPVTATQRNHKSYGLFVLAAVLFLLACTALFFGFANPLALALSGLMIMGSVYLVRISNTRGGVRRVEVGVGGAAGATRRSGLLLWVLGGGSAAAVGVSFFYLYNDALNGYHGIGPVYAFAASALVAALVWAYLATKLMGR